MKTYQQMLNESFMRLPGNVIGNELYEAKKMFEAIYSTQTNGDDFKEKDFNNLIKKLQDIKKQAKKFEKAEDVPVSYQYKDK
jgi:hypothetical protein